jgi:uncharacterized protein YcbK (DUF882 family)|nr:MAG TPA: peptidase [Caudoviricetes sp.]
MKYGVYIVEDVTTPDNLDAKVSDHFKLTEFKCSDNSRVVVLNDELVTVLEKARLKFGEAIKINSGYRTVAYNSTLKDASPKSQHTHGNAADIVVRDVKPIDVYNYFNETYPDTYGVGIYNTFVHIDVRPNKARWDYRTKEK